jgi:uncharacterized protein
MNTRMLLLASFSFSIVMYLLTGNNSVALINTNRLYDLQHFLIVERQQVNEDEVLQDIYQGRYDKLEAFLDTGGNPDRFLHSAVNNGAQEAVEIMLKRGANVNAVDLNNDNLTPLMVAASHTYRVGGEMSELLIKYGANVNARASRGSTPIMFASWGTDEYVKVIKLLLKNGAKVNVKNKMGTTPLSIARSGNWKKIVQVLIRAGAKS